MARTKRIAIIGAGIGGLSAAAILSRHAEVDVYERAGTAGGKVRQIEMDGARIDSGPTVFTMAWVFEEVFERAGTRFRNHVTPHRLDMLARHAWPDGSRLDLFADRREAADAIGVFAGAGEARRYLAFCDRTARIFKTLRDPYMRAPKASFLRLITQRSPFALLATAPFGTLWKSLEGAFEDVRLRQLFGRYATYCGASPFEAPATLMLIAHVEQEGVCALEGGMQAIAQGLAAAARANGARFHYGAHVEGISVTGGRASGIRLANGQHHTADAVVFNGDVAALAGGRLGTAVAGAVRVPPAVKRSQSAMTWSMLAETSGLDLDMHNVFFSDDYRAEFDAVFGAGRVPDQPTVYVCAPDRLGGIAPAGAERLFCLINAPPNGGTHSYGAVEVDAYRSRMVAQLARCGLNVTIDPNRTVVTTPGDFARMFPDTGGALYGLANHGWQASFQRPGIRTRLPGLYLAGGSVHPGPGVPMAALSGMTAANEVLGACVSN